LGILWIVLYPLAVAVILNYVFSYIFRIPIGEIPYFLFVFSGLVVWSFFEQSIHLSKDCLVWNRELITKAAFPKSSIPLSYIISKILDLIISYLILLGLYGGSGFSIGIQSICLIFGFLPLVLFTSGIGLMVSMANAIFKDIGKTIELLLMVIFYASPIIYSHTSVPAKYTVLLYINPLSLTIMNLRSSLFEHVFRLDLFLLNLLIGAISFIVGLYLFLKFEKKMTDLI